MSWYRSAWKRIVVGLCPALILAMLGDARAEGTPRGMVASVHPLATDAGVAAFREGGNAVDAAVATALTLGVVDGHNSGIGGGCFILIRQPDGDFLALDGRETAPAQAHREMYVSGGQLQPQQSKIGPLASATPGALAAYDLAIRKCGRRELRELLLPAARLADDGFALDAVYARKLAATASILTRFSGSRQVLLKQDGSAYQEGERFRQADLARTYRAVAEQGVSWFYQGPFAQSVAAWMIDQGGMLGEGDFAAYRPLEREPIVSSYRGYTIVGFPPPSSGGIHVAQILNILEHFDLGQLHKRDPSQFMHVVLEAMKLAFADRAHWLGDADFAPVPRGLIDRDYAARLASQIDPNVASALSSHGHPPRAGQDLFGRHTTHVAAADAEGWWVAITATVNTTFGSKVIIPGTGVIMNNQMDDFSIQPGVPNAFGLIGAEANCVEPGKRPLSSMSPTIVLKDGRPVLTLGAAGGPKIITQVVLALVHHIDLGLPVDEAVAAPRFHHQWSPDAVLVETTVPPDLVQKLRDRGHTVRSSQHMGVTQAVAVSGENASLVGVHDPRVPGKTASY